jgi:serine/threonine-protein kinase RsbT
MKDPSSDHPLDIILANYEDVILARQKARELMQAMGFSLLAQTRIVTAVSELARNIVVHAGQGLVTVKAMEKSDRKGIECVFQDKGPGIQNIEQAMSQGFSTSRSLGLGLGGAKKLCTEFDIQSTVGKGTQVTIREWKTR